MINDKILETFHIMLPSQNKKYGYVYMIYDYNNNISYIGQSKNIFCRLSCHYLDKSINKIVLHKVRVEDLIEVEDIFIQNHKPYLNRCRKSKINISLKEYLKNENISIDEFSQMSNVKRFLLDAALSGIDVLRFHEKENIYKSTNGKVGINQWKLKKI